MMALTTPLGKAEPSKFGVALSLEYQVSLHCFTYFEPALI